MTAAATAAATTSTTAALAATATAAAATASRGEHRIVDNKSDLTTQILDVIDGSLFQERHAVRVHQEFDAFHVQDRVVGLGLFFHG